MMTAQGMDYKGLRKDQYRVAVDVQQTLYDGVAMRSYVAILRREVLEAKQQRIEIDCSAEAFSKMLAMLCGKEIAPKIPEDLSEEVANESRTMELFDRQTSLLALREKQLDAALRPKLSLFAQGFYDYPGLNMYDDMFNRAWSLNGMVGVRLNWNFSALYTRTGDKKRLATQREQIANARDVFSFNSSLLQTQEQQCITRSRRLLAEDDEIIALSREVRESAEAKLAEGIIDTPALLQEITREQQAQIRRAEHEIEMHQHLAELKYLQGK